MNSRNYVQWAAILLMVAAASCATVEFAVQPADSPETVEEILAAMPAEDAAVRQQCMTRLAQLGPSSVNALCGLILPMGAGDDAAARTALNGLAMYVSRPGAEPERQMFSKAIEEGLASASETEVKAFLIEQLQYAGKDEAVPVLATYLDKEDLCDPAARALTAIGAAPAVDAVVKALDGAQGACLVSLIQAAGDLRAEGASDAILPHASAGDAVLRRTALLALANIGAPAAGGLLEAVMSGDSDGYEKAMAASWYLLFAQRRAEDGNAKECAEICRALIETRADAPNLQSAALSLLLDVDGKKAQGDLVAALDSENSEFRGGALRMASRMPNKSATRQWVEKLETVAPEVQIEVMRMLADRGDTSALPALLSMMKNENKDVRLEAIRSSAQLGGPTAINAIQTLMRDTEDADDVATAKAGLLRMPMGKIGAVLAGSLPSMPPVSRVAVLEVLGERRASDHAEAVFAQTADADESVRVAALKALGNLASPADMARLVELTLASATDAERAAAQKTVIAVGGDIEDPQARAEAVLAALPGASKEKKPLLLQVLPKLAGEKALAAAIEGTGSTDAAVKDVAVRALAEWPDASAAPALLQLAQSEKEVPHQVLALNGYVRVVGASDADAAKKVAMLKEAMAAAQRPEERKQVLAGLSAVRTIESLQYVGTFLDDESIREEAVSAAVQIACPRDEKDKGIIGPEVITVLRKTAAVTANEDARKKAQLHVQSIGVPDEEGFVYLFNGKDLTGWVGDTQGYAAEDGKLVCKPGGNLYSEKEYGDFVLRFEFKLPPGGNNGLAVRTPIGGGAYDGMELQILDNTAEKYKDLQPYQYHGSIYGIVPAKREFLKPVGEWNEQEVVAKGRQITVILNGTVIVDANLDEATKNGTMDHKEHAGLDRASGHVGFLGHGDIIEFRNIRIKELK